MQTIPLDASVVVLTGAGISVASGIPPFRGPGGIWNDIEVEEVISAEGLQRDRSRVFAFLDQLRTIARKAKPNEAHLALARAEAARLDGARFDVVTQNIDNLHRRAGSKRVHEVHGSLEVDCCEQCEKRFEHNAVHKCSCGGLIRPDVVLFGEMLPAEVLAESSRMTRQCDYFISVGTSGVVWPAAGFVLEARAAGACCIHVNLEPSGNRAFEQELLGPAEKILPELLGV